jgi:hypothetical protein
MAGQRLSRETLAYALLAGAGALALYAAIVAWTGGFEFRVAGLTLTSHAWIRPAVAAAVLALLSGALARTRVTAAAASAWRRLDTPAAARLLALAALAWIVAAGILYGTFAVGGSDSYGYVSQAALLAEGRLTDTVPHNPAYTWYLAHQTLTPLGYRPSAEPGRIAPVYPPGFPLLLAPAWYLSPSYVYYVVPLFGGLAVWLCYRLGRALGDPLAGGLAAALLSVSPAMLFQNAQPMSDVPATACWLGSLLLAGVPGAWRAATAGALTSLAILIRPNLAPLAIAPLVLVVWLAPDPRARVRHAALFVAAAIPGAAALAWIQHVRYGSPLASGYGSISVLFSWENIPPNLRQYPKWLTDTHTPFVWFCALAPLALARASPRARALGWSALLVVAAIFSLYLPYVAFKRHEWTYLRFLLPAIPLMLLLASRATLAFVRHLPPAARAPLAAVFFGAILVYSATTAEKRRAFELRTGEQRYADAGAFVRQRLPPNAIVLAGQHSGSVRLYGDRPILRFDLLEPPDLDRAIETLRATGLMPFMVVDPWERSAFDERFSAPPQKTLEAVRLVRVVSGVQIYAID